MDKEKSKYSNRGGKGGSRKAPEMAQFYKKLDEACLDAVGYLHAIVKKATENILIEEWRREGIAAAGKLIQKAPERINDPRAEGLPLQIVIQRFQPPANTG